MHWIPRIPQSIDYCKKTQRSTLWSTPSGSILSWQVMLAQHNRLIRRMPMIRFFWWVVLSVPTEMHPSHWTDPVNTQYPNQTTGKQHTTMFFLAVKSKLLETCHTQLKWHLYNVQWRSWNGMLINLIVKLIKLFESAWVPMESLDDYGATETVKLLFT